MFDFISIGETLLAFLQEDTSLWLSWFEKMVGSTTKGPTSAPDHHDLPSLISSVTSMAWTADSTGDFQHSETSKSCSFLLWLLFFVATFKKWLGLCAQWWSSVLPCSKRCGENQTYLPMLLRCFLHLESRRWLGNEGHSETGQRKKVSDSFPWHWKNPQMSALFLVFIIQHERKILPENLPGFPSSQMGFASERMPWQEQMW